LKTKIQGVSWIHKDFKTKNPSNPSIHGSPPVSCAALSEVMVSGEAGMRSPRAISIDVLKKIIKYSPEKKHDFVFTSGIIMMT